MVKQIKMYKLRPYQEDAVSAAIKYINTNYGKRKVPKSIIVAPTGAGKSLYIANIVLQTNLKTIVIQPNIELLSQNYEKYVSYGFEASIFSSGLKSKELSEVVFATIGSIKAVTEVVRDEGYGLIIIDECDRMTKKGSMIDTFINETGIDRVIGLTATPVELRLYSTGPDLVMINRSRSNLFTSIIHVTQIYELLDMGFWSPINYKSYDVNTKVLRLNGSGTEFTDESLHKFFTLNRLDSKVAKLIEIEGRKHNLVFVPDIECAKMMSKSIPGAKSVYHGMPTKERVKIVKDFKAGKINTVINCNILSIGFDFPELDHIIMTRPTNSFALYYQQIGRGVRTHQNKKDILISDLSNNTFRFGRLEGITFMKNDKGQWDMYNNGSQMTNIGYKTPTSRVPKMIFGKDKGKPLTEIETGLLEWVCRKFATDTDFARNFVENCRKELCNRLG